MVCFILACDKREFDKYKAGTLESDLYLDIRKDDGSLLAPVIVRLLTSADGAVGPLIVVLKEDEKNNCKNQMDASKTKDLLEQLVEVFARTHDALKKAIVRVNAHKRIVDCLEDCMNKVCAETEQDEYEAVEESADGASVETIAVAGSTRNIVCSDTIAFIHWGGGTPRTYENNFSQLLEEYLKSSDRQFTKSIRAYAFSSRRAELFDVTKSKIEFPTTIEEVKALEDKFKGAKNAVDARKIMTEYVLEAETAKKKPTRTSSKDVVQIATECDVFSDAVSKVVEKIGEEWESGYLEEDEQAIRADLVAHYKNMKPPVCNVADVKVIELFKKILEEGSQNG